MEASLKYKVSEIFSRYNFSKEDSVFISEVLNEIDERQNQKFELKAASLATKEFVKDEIHRLELKVEQTKNEVTKAIFWTSLIQFLAIVGAIVGIISFMLRK